MNKKTLEYVESVMNRWINKSEAFWRGKGSYNL